LVMQTQLSVATWNLERPAARSWKKLPAILGRLATVSADCWVLTETRASITPGKDYFGIHSPAHAARRKDTDERWVSVWSRWPNRSIPVRESFWSATALVDAELGQMIVHGVVLPYRNEQNTGGGRSLVWAEFHKELILQAEDWAALRREYPGIPLVVTGDFNQNLDGAQWYGTPETRRLFRLALDGAGLQCLTEEDAVKSGRLKRHHLVDHICVSTEFSGGPEFACWEPEGVDGNRLSDHPGVVARLSVDGERITSTL
jgi:endonuclease/exonuclease/phosphatase family metal-dependent hydrolase